MEEITLCIGVAAAALVLLVSPRRGLIVYLIVLLCYPSYLRIIVSGCTVSAGRIVVTALLMRCLLDEQLRRGFRWTRLDTLVIIADAVYVLVLSSATADTLAALKFMSGGILDSTFAYFSARLIINNRTVLIHVVKWAAVILVVMALLGVFEATTTRSPYKGLLKYRFHAERSLGAKKMAKQEVKVGHGHELRWGFFRAQGSHPHPIIFGASFAVFVPLVWKLFSHTRWKLALTGICGAIVLGGASSMSSTPWSGLLVALAGLVFERLKRWAKPLLVLAVLFCIFVEFYSDKHHFYYVLMARSSVLGGAGHARAQLMDAAVKHLPEYWLAGYGFKDPGWGAKVSGMDYTDVCVHYVFLAVMYGVFGLLAYLAIVGKLLSSLWRRYRQSVETIDRDICWGIIVSIAVILTVHLGTTPFGILLSLNSVIFGIGGSVISPEFKGEYVTARRL